MKVLVCGGSGYIGSHLVRELSKTNQHDIIIMDNLSKGHKEANDPSIPLEIGDIRVKEDVERVFFKHEPDAVFGGNSSCAWIEVGESCMDPLKYYENNVPVRSNPTRYQSDLTLQGTITLLQAMQKYHTKYFIFSSTAAIFGIPTKIPIQAEDIPNPINPYGDTKLAVENVLRWCDAAFGLKSVCLRYFNACGADKNADIGEDHEPESHLIPIVLQVPLGKREKVYMFGTDYDTKDGTCVRDYVHVTDLATAHIQALDFMVKHQKSEKFNLGSGKGYSVKEIIESARRVTGHAIPAEAKERRPGDPPFLIAASEKAETMLGWKRQYDNIDDIVRSAWEYHQKHPNGFGHSKNLY